MTMGTTVIPITLTSQIARLKDSCLRPRKVPVESAGLRTVQPGGCSATQPELEERPQDDDFVIESAGVRLFVDEFSSQYLNGIKVDYRSNFQESGFAFENPNATGGCGCGSSFTV
jgi:iron-sulfur cluster assembly protein